MNEELNYNQSQENAKEQEPQPARSEDSMRQAILRSINAGDVSRKPKWRFILQGIFTAVGGILVLLAAVYLASAVVFALRVNGVWFLPTLGLAGISPFLRSLPWVFLVLSVIFAILLYALVRRYSFSYGRPLLYSALAVVIVVSASAVLIGLTSFHQGIFQQAHDGRLPFPGSPIYENFGRTPHDVTIGVITAMNSKDWEIKTHEDGSYKVTITSSIPLPQNAQVGDEVVVLGARHDKTIDAEAIRPLQHRNNSPAMFPSSNLNTQPAPPVQ